MKPNQTMLNDAFYAIEVRLKKGASAREIIAEYEANAVQCASRASRTPASRHALHFYATVINVCLELECDGPAVDFDC